MNIIKNACITWVQLGIFAGVLHGGATKIQTLMNENIERSRKNIPNKIVINEYIDSSITCIENVSKVTIYAGIGGIIGGLTAATAPVSIPAYIYMKNLDTTPVTNDN